MSKYEAPKTPWFNYVGFAILAACYLGALWNVYNVKKDEVFEGKKVIRICHWQLELGYRKAMQTLIDKFEKRYPDVKVIQIPVSERTYGQFVTTQLIGRTAPDLIEMGFFNVKDSTPRYFIPLTDILRKPNPFNADNPKLAKVPWMETFSDGLQSAYVPELVDYYKVGFNTFTIRIFYNKNLFRSVLGTDAPPKNIEEFFTYCEKIKEYERSWNERVAAYNANHNAKKSKLSLVPIASARYQTQLFKSRYNTILTFDRYLDLDEDCDGKVMNSELFAGMLGGERIVNDEKYRIANQLLKRMANYFPRGFMSLGRMDSGFAFVQSRAGMITSGSWDASSYIKQAQDQPPGDVIVSIDGEKVSSAREAVAKLMEKAHDGNVSLVVSRDGIESTKKLHPINDGKNVFECYGMELENIADAKKGSSNVVVTIVDSESPASRAGLKPKKSFEMGVFDFPLPLKSDPVYGKYVVGKVAELARTGGAFGVCKFSKNQDVAIKFLQFCTTPENNELFNKICQWMPVVKGAKIPKDLIPFKPHPEGYYAALGFNYLQRSGTLEEQAFWPFISEPSVKYDWFEKKILKSLPEALARDYITSVRNVREQVPDKMVRRSSFLADAIFADVSTSKRSNEKLAAAWDVLWYAMTEMNRYNAQIKPYELKSQKDEFNKAFFEFLNRN